MSKLLVSGLLLTALAIGAEQTMAGRNRARSTTTAASSRDLQHVSVAQRGFKKIEFEIRADSLVQDTTIRFERR